MRDEEENRDGRATMDTSPPRLDEASPRYPMVNMMGEAHRTIDAAAKRSVNVRAQPDAASRHLDCQGFRRF